MIKQRSIVSMEREIDQLKEENQILLDSMIDMRLKLVQIKGYLEQIKGL